MLSLPRIGSRRSGPLLGVVLVAVASFAVLSPAVPPVRALDPTPDPGASAAPSPEPAPTVAPATEPDPTPTPEPTVEPTAAPDPGTTPDPAASESPSAEPSAAPSEQPAITTEVTRTWISSVDRAGKVTDRLGAGETLQGMRRFAVYRVRFQVVNRGDEAVSLRPSLEAGSGATPDLWTEVPYANPVQGSPFYIAADKGRRLNARVDDLGVGDFRSERGPGDNFKAVDGLTVAGVRPEQKLKLPAAGFTEIEFAIRATIDADWNATYAFRLSDPALASDVTAVVTLGDKPTIKLSPSESTGLTGAGDLASGSGFSLAAATTPDDGPLYRLDANVNPASPHIVAALGGAGCGSCHKGHTATGSDLAADNYRSNPLKAIDEPYDPADFALCYQCHSQTPFLDTSGDPNLETNFAAHGYHMGDIHKVSGDVDIMTPGDGQGFGLCAECHFNLHGVPTAERGLVMFSPNVLPYNGQIEYDAVGQTCTLTCHGRDHDAMPFEAAEPGI
jgi:hypothetical protein